MNDADAQRRQAHAQDVALFRYALIREAADPALSAARRGQLVRAIAEATHRGPDGEPVRVSRQTLDRWIRTYRAGGFQALVPSARRVEPRTPAGLLELACQLRKEDPHRSATHIAEILRAVHDWSPHPRTLQRHFKALGLTRPQLSATTIAFGRFEASRPNELWVGDALHGPVVAGKKAILFCYLDDHSRLVTGHRWTYVEDTLSAEAALRRGVVSRGVPDAVYLDNGSSFCSKQLLRALAVLGSRLVHSRPGRPQGRGKVERFFRTVRDQFLVEVAHSDITSLEVLEERFVAWVERVYHARVHSETGETPLERFRGCLPRIPAPERVREAFLFSEWRTVTKTATVSLFSNHYEVDQALVGRKVELVFDPFDLEEVTVRYMDTDFGRAVPHRIGRHTHPMARPQPEPGPRTGIDYLRLLDERHRAELARDVAPLRFADLSEAADSEVKENDR
ncbi:MAG: DDE-type integrase/transposase/recombinase [Actinomycetota bacterium]|nr:DDE-type integrase/transposase/recombinase [Actinomycetota bacterium]